MTPKIKDRPMRLALFVSTAAVLTALASPAAAADANPPYTFLLSRIDGGVSTKGDADVDWDAQGWIGGDENRLWVKSSGNQQPKGGPSRADVQALYSHAITEFWDVQAGVAQTVDPGARTSAVFGIQGLAPYWFEVGAAGIVSDRGRISARLEAAYELTLTQRIFAEPYAAVRLATRPDTRLREGGGLTDGEAGLRLRYEVTRKIAPYVGVSWQRRYGETGRLWTRAGGEAEETSFRAGLRLLF